MKHLCARINNTDEKIDYIFRKEIVAFAEELFKNPPRPLFKTWEILRMKGWINCNYGDTSSNDENGYLHWWYPENDEEILELFLINHDWYFQMADDHRSYVNGMKSLEKIKLFMTMTGYEKGTALWNKYAPDDMKMK